jgi:murein DD-endopeptidase MepM/ murein hydrolase activator NlpD
MLFGRNSTLDPIEWIKSLLMTIIIPAAGILLLIIMAMSIITVIVATPLGIFFSGSNEGENTVDVLAQINGEYTAAVMRIVETTPHDEVEYSGEKASWRDVMAVYAVKYNLSNADEAKADVIEWDEKKKNALREVFWDMNVLQSDKRTEKSTVPEKVLNPTTQEWEETGNTVEVETVILIITTKVKTAMEMADEYAFNVDDRELLTDILSSEFDSEWEDILGEVSRIEQGNVVIGNGALSWPCSGTVTSEFGHRSKESTHGVGSTEHPGIDISGPNFTGTPIHAAADGKVTLASWYFGYGNTVIIDHGGGLKTLYGHNSALKVRVGDKVVRGDTIALAGNTGNSDGAHCHFEVRVNDIPDNPRKYL